MPHYSKRLDNVTFWDETVEDSEALDSVRGDFSELLDGLLETLLSDTELDLPW